MGQYLPDGVPHRAGDGERGGRSRPRCCRNGHLLRDGSGGMRRREPLGRGGGAVFALAGCARRWRPAARRAAAPLRAGEPAVGRQGRGKRDARGRRRRAALSLAFRMADGGRGRSRRRRSRSRRSATAWRWSPSTSSSCSSRRTARAACSRESRARRRVAGQTASSGTSRATTRAARSTCSTCSGRDRIVASGLSSAGLLAPQADGRLFMVAADKRRSRWVVARRRGGARCLTNCDLDDAAALGRPLRAAADRAPDAIASRPSASRGTRRMARDGRW